MNVGALELLALLLLAVPCGGVVWACIDAASTPDWVWQGASQSKVVWVALLTVGVFVCIVGFVVAFVYATTIRPSLVRVRQGGSG